MSPISPRGLLRCTAVVVVGFVLLCSSLLWGEPLFSSPRVLPALWQKHFPAQLTGLDLTWAGQTVAITVAPFTSKGDSHLHVYDLTGRELWTTTRRSKILGLSLSHDGQYTAIGLMDFSIALFAKDGELLWERKSVGIPTLSLQRNSVVTFNAGITRPADPLLEVFHQDGNKVWSLYRKGRVWRSIVSDQSDLLIGLWNDEVLLIDRQYRMTWQRLLPKEIMALAIFTAGCPIFCHWGGRRRANHPSLRTNRTSGVGAPSPAWRDGPEPGTARGIFAELWQYYSRPTPSTLSPHG